MSMSLKRRSLSTKKRSLKRFSSEKTQFLISKLEIDTLINTNLLDITDYKNNQDYFKEIVFSRRNSSLTRMWLIHLLGGMASADHFFHQNGSLKNDKNIHKQILSILSWRGTELNDYWWYQKISKQLSRTWGNMMLVASYLKNILHFFKIFIKRFFQIFNITKFDSKNSFNLIFGSSLGLFYFVNNNKFDNIINTMIEGADEGESLINKIKTSSLITLLSFVIVSLIISIYESYYYQIERDHLRKYLNQGLTDNHRTQIVKFKELLFEFDEMVTDLSLRDNLDLFTLIDKYYDRLFKKSLFSFFGRKTNLKTILKNELQQHRDLSDFYLELKKIKYFYPLAIYFFKQNGHPRSTRESVCSIIQGLKNISSKTMKILHQNSIISSKRQLNLTMSRRSNNSVKKTIKKKRH